jgi:hypothetical protein
MTEIVTASGMKMTLKNLRATLEGLHLPIKAMVWGTDLVNVREEYLIRPDAAPFISGALNALPALLDRIESLEREVREARAAGLREAAGIAQQAADDALQCIEHHHDVEWPQPGYVTQDQRSSDHGRRYTALTIAAALLRRAEETK